jgi:energy-coupling factor transporter transmembrane protein EcfT
MESTLIYAVIAGIAMVLIFFSARVAMRWLLRLVVVGLILLLALGGVAWWWLADSNRANTQQRPTNSRPSNSNRRP